VVIDFIKQYHTLDKFTIQDILPLSHCPTKRSFYIEELIFPEEGIVDIKKYIVKMNVLRYKVFEKNINCYGCGIVGSMFYLQQHKKMNKCTKDNVAHLNLYAEDTNNINDGNLILMTQDHIIPTAKGGKNILNNLKTMCAICNLNKADTLLEE
jgi:hypothetical protein